VIYSQVTLNDNVTMILKNNISSDKGAATDVQLGFLVATGAGLPPGTHLEQVVVTGPVEKLAPQRLREAWQATARRHDILRMLLRRDEAGQVRLVELAIPQVDLRVLDWSDVPAGEMQDRQEELLRQDRLMDFDLAARPGWRVTCVDLGHGQGWMVWTIHHALIDGTSIALVLADLWRHPDCEKPSEPPAVSFVQAVTQMCMDREGAKAFFRDMLEAENEATQLPAGPEVALPRMAHVSRNLAADTSEALRCNMTAMGATPLNAVQAAWALVLARWTGQSAACFGLVDSGRARQPELSATVGCLISTLPMQVTMPPATTLSGLLSHLRRLTLGMREHTHASLTDIRRWTGRSAPVPLFDTVLMYTRNSLQSQLDHLGCGWQDARLIEQGSALITLAVYDGSEAQLVMEYDSARLAPDRAVRMLDHVHRLLETIARARPETLVDELDMLSPEETVRLLDLGEPKVVIPALGDCPATRFEAVAANQPDRIAIIDAATAQRLDYAQLDGTANALAWKLSRAGLGPGDVVALHLARGPDQVAAMLAVLKIGAAFLPLDPEQPAPLLASLITNVSARGLIAPASSLLASADLVHVVPDGQHEATAPPRPAARPGQLAYVIHTSGSTGRPKAVMGLGSALCAHATAVIAEYGLTTRDRVLQFAALSFDVMLEEIWPSLLAGATVVLRDDRAVGSLAGFLDLVAEQRLSVLNLPASFWHLLVSEMSDHVLRLPPAVRLVVTGSERISARALRRWQRVAPGIGWINGYGPTEATITCTSWRLPQGADPYDPGDDVPIGRPLGHARAILRAPDGSLSPEGAEGILWIGGAAVSGGYLNDPHQTEAVFADDPWLREGRLYCTGDRARWRDDGQLSFLGRRDRQIKLRGHRIDLGQIEAVLNAQPEVRQVHVALDDGPPPRLVAWLTCDPHFDLNKLSQRLLRKLPGYMVPVLMRIESLPLTPNGKIDGRALPRPAFVPSAEPGKIEDKLTQAIASCMAEVLECDVVPADAAFQDLGGDSLLALRLAGLIQARTGFLVQAADLSQHPTSEALARKLRLGTSGPQYIIPIQPEGTMPPIFAVHVLGRNESLFRPLSAVMGANQPFYGLSVGLPQDLSTIDVEETARIYFEEVQEHFPVGPVSLIAVSMASYFAFELAQLLSAAGREVLVLGMLDSMGPGGRPALGGNAKLRMHIAQMRQRGFAHFASMAQNILARRRDKREEKQALPDDISIRNLILANVRAVGSYKPRPYKGRLTVFRADQAFWDSPEALRTCLGWASVAKGGAELFDLPGTHLSILQPGNVEVLAQHLQRLVHQRLAEQQ